MKNIGHTCENKCVLHEDEDDGQDGGGGDGERLWGWTNSHLSQGLSARLKVSEVIMQGVLQQQTQHMLKRCQAAGRRM